MIRKAIFVCLCATLCCVGNSHAQEDDYALDALLLAEFDTLSLISLLDSLLALEDLRSSALILRMGYVSQILNAGRDMGIEQYGVTPGISYYHKSGAFGDIAGYWNSETTPGYNLTTLTLGYLTTLTPSWSLILSYDHAFYHHEDSLRLNNLFNNTIHLSSNLYWKFLETGLDYSFIFGDDNAHRMRWHLAALVSFRNVGIFNRISVSPTFSMLFGNQKIISNRFPYWRQLTDRQRFRVLQNGTVLLLTEEDDVFGLMSYDLSLPIILRSGAWGLSFSYHYNIPVALPGEFNSNLRDNQFFSASLSYSIKR